MQIIGGTASGIHLTVPKGFLVRPTLARSRKSLFDSMGSLQNLKSLIFLLEPALSDLKPPAGAPRKFGFSNPNPGTAK